MERSKERGIILPGLSTVYIGVVLGITLGNDLAVLAIGQYRIANALHLLESDGIAVNVTLGSKTGVQLFSQRTVGQGSSFQTDGGIMGAVESRLGAGDGGGTALDQLIGGLIEAAALDVVVIGIGRTAFLIQRLANDGSHCLTLGVLGISGDTGNDLTRIVAGDHLIVGVIDPAHDTGSLTGIAVDQTHIVGIHIATAAGNIGSRNTGSTLRRGPHNSGGIPAVDDLAVLPTAYQRTGPLAAHDQTAGNTDVLEGGTLGRTKKCNGLAITVRTPINIQIIDGKSVTVEGTAEIAGRITVADTLKGDILHVDVCNLVNGDTA